MIKLDIRINSRRSQLRLFSVDRYTHSSQSIISQLQNFLQSINRMCNVVLVPNRLTAIDSTSAPISNTVGQDLQQLYQLLTEADHQLRWGGWAAEQSQPAQAASSARRLADTKNSVESSADVSDLEASNEADDADDEIDSTTERLNQVDLDDQPLQADQQTGESRLVNDGDGNASAGQQLDAQTPSHASRRHSLSQRNPNKKTKKKTFVHLDENSNPIDQSDDNQTEGEDDDEGGLDLRCRKCRSKRRPLMSLNCSRCAHLLVKTRQRMLSRGLSLIKKINHRTSTLSKSRSTVLTTHSRSSKRSQSRKEASQQKEQEQDRHLQERLEFHLKQMVAILNELSEAAEQLSRRYLQAIEE